jgi:hypothetical protein
MTRTLSPGALLLFAIVLALEPQAVSAAEKAEFKPADDVPFYGDANCMVRKGKMKGAALNGAEVTAQARGCLSLQLKDGTRTFVLRASTSKCAKMQMASGPVAAVSAGSQGASECKGN